MKYLFYFFLFNLILLPQIVMGSGFRIPNQSFGAVGLAGAHIAVTPGPDSSYYNPANMSLLDDSFQLDAGLSFLQLPAITYKDNRSTLFNGSSKEELIYLPQLHVNSQEYGKMRFGFSLVYPFGLSKRWEQLFPQMYAQEFSLLVTEGNPTFSYILFDKIRLGGGIRLLYGSGQVKTKIENPPATQLGPFSSLSRELDGSDWGAGYNLALTILPMDGVVFSTTYRSKVVMDLDGKASFKAGVGNSLTTLYAGGGGLEVPLPAVWSIATAYIYKKITIEVVWDRTFWSSFDQLDFEYDQSFLGSQYDGFDRSIPKKWKDSDALRLGLTVAWNKRWKSTLGFAYDRTPIPEKTLGFELPGSDALIYSSGIEYKYSDTFQVGVSYMYHHTKSRAVRNSGVAGLPGIDGNFSDGGAHVVTVGAIYQF